MTERMQFVQSLGVRCEALCADWPFDWPFDGWMETEAQRVRTSKRMAFSAAGQGGPADMACVSD